MTLKEQQIQIQHLQQRTAVLVEELRVTQGELKRFKETVANDIQLAFKLIKEKR
jgi:hypothetical protein